MVKDLENEFTGVGDTSGFKFTKLNSTDKGFFYSVDVGEGKCHYEVFEKKFVPICLDFEKKIFSETEFKYIYPKSEAFGKWAWCIVDYNKAVEKFKSL
mgnify:CR=1 FL=1